jgi:hypothetical protein
MNTMACNETAGKLAKKGTTAHTKEIPFKADTLKELFKLQNSSEVQTRSQRAGRNKEMERCPQNLGRVQRQS